jgi:uncharacterized protein
MKTALITGASFGIGAAFAKELAARKVDLVLVARSEDKLQQLAQELTQQHQIQANVITCDLSIPGAAQNLFEKVIERGLSIDLLINNAGFGDYGAFADRKLEKFTDMIQLNIMALMQLTHLFLPAMRQKGFGGIINVASIAGYQALPYMAVYAATKAFVLNFSEAIWAENKDAGVNILALCPCPTESKFFEMAEFPASFGGKASPSKLVSAEEVVKDALKALENKQSTLVTGGLVNQVIVNLPRLFPRDLLVNAVEKQFKEK